MKKGKWTKNPMLTINEKIFLESERRKNNGLSGREMGGFL